MSGQILDKLLAVVTSAEFKMAACHLGQHYPVEIIALHNKCSTLN